MNTEDKALDRVREILRVADYPSTEDIGSFFDALVGALQGVKEELKADSKAGITLAAKKIEEAIEALEALESRMSEADAVMKKALSKDIQGLRTSLEAKIKEVSASIPSLPDEFDPSDLHEAIEAIKAGIPSIEDLRNDIPKLGEQIRNALELLQGEERLDALSIKNLPEGVREIVRQISTASALYALADVDVAGIVAGQSIQWDGIKWMPFTPAGSGGTPVWGENLTPQGPGDTFVLAHSPIAGSVRIFRGGAYQSVSNGDYTIVNDTITLSPALANGEVLVADYSW